MFVLPKKSFEAKGSVMKYFNAIYLTALLLVMLSGCGMSDQEAASSLAQVQSQITDRQSKPDAETANLCQGETDKKHMFGSNLEFAKAIQDSVKRSGFSAYFDKGDFKKKYPEMTDACVDCFDQLTKCAVNNCGWGICSDLMGTPQPETFQCQDCSAKACHDAMFKCSGVRTKEIPSLLQK
jgi:hypothetical protein